MTKSNIYEKSPIKVSLEKEKLYSFCTCGYSEKPPFCDGAHKTKAPDFKSFKFTVEKDKDVWLCQCKATQGMPFCDGSHKDL